MIRVLVYEYICCECEAPAATAGASLFAEGWAMLSAVVEDFLAVPNVEVIVALADHIKVPDSWSGAKVNRFTLDGLSALARSADFALVIAPEFARILESRCQMVNDAGTKLLGSTIPAIALAADKLELSDHLMRHSVATPTTVPFTTHPPFPGPWVVKPRDGAGSQDTFFVDDAGRLPAEMANAIVQPFIPGFAASVAFLIGEQQVIAMPPCSQRLSGDGRFHYLGGQTPIEAQFAERATALGLAAIKSVPGLSGYVGVDLVLGECDMVIEINPRLTTSYVGLRQLAVKNLAEAMLKLKQGVAVDMHWRSEPTQW